MDTPDTKSSHLSWYRKWHEQPNHSRIHWATFLAVCLIVSSFLVNQTKDVYQHITLVPTVMAATGKPNIVVILTDDQRWDTAGVDVMPKLHQIIGNDGVKFNNAFLNTALCCPSRASILTGQYTHNHGILSNNQAPAKFKNSGKDRSTVATWLNSVGYHTGLFGKYLNNFTGSYIPPGWDRFVVKAASGFYNYNLYEDGATVFYNNNPINYSTTVLANKAVNFIETAPVTEPVFVYYSPVSPHRPYTPEFESDKSNFLLLPAWRPPSFNEADVSDKPLWIQNLSSFSSSTIAGIDKARIDQLGALQSVDRAIESIKASLERTGRLENTVWIFLSDNGYMWGEHRLDLTKTCVYEECVRGVLMIKAPGITPHEENNLVLNVDLASTIADFAGVTPTTMVNGRSLKTIMENPLATWRSEILLEVRGGGPQFWAIRSHQYKYVKYNTGEREFYDLTNDPYELTSLHNDPAYSAIIKDLNTKLQILKAQ